MPIHDWTRVDAGIFHAFHHDWISEIAHALNRGVLPEEYYALPEQITGKFGPDVLTLQGPVDGDSQGNGEGSSANRSGILTLPKIKPIAQTDLEFYRRKQKAIAIRHTTDDGVVAIIEIVSPGNKAARKPMRKFIEKAADLLEHGIHLLIVDLHPPGKRDPNGIHAEIWQEIAGDDYVLPTDKPFTFAAYETGDGVTAYVLHAGLGDPIPDMPLFLELQKTVSVPLEATYNAAFVEQPRRWRRVLDPGDPGA
ncbi:MAG: DUF4058 family protein [Planctomycetes bacterium]|nr:DUF4058 family protein [Planctomycetota bacterium]